MLATETKSFLTKELQRILETRKQRRESLTAEQLDLHDYEKEFAKRKEENTVLHRVNPSVAEEFNSALDNAQQYIKNQREGLADGESEVERLETEEEEKIAMLREAVAASSS